MPEGIWKLWLFPAILALIFPGSAAVAQLAVNELVVGSNPTRGANEVCDPGVKVRGTFTLGFERLFGVLVQLDESKSQD